MRHLSGFLRSLGVKFVFDLGTARDIALIEGAKEFISKYRSSRMGNTAQSGVLEENLASMPNAQAELPILSSSCPG